MSNINHDRKRKFKIEKDINVYAVGWLFFSLYFAYDFPPHFSLVNIDLDFNSDHQVLQDKPFRKGCEDEKSSSSNRNLVIIHSRQRSEV